MKCPWCQAEVYVWRRKERRSLPLSGQCGTCRKPIQLVGKRYEKKLRSWA